MQANFKATEGEHHWKGLSQDTLEDPLFAYHYDLGQDRERQAGASLEFRLGDSASCSSAVFITFPQMGRTVARNLKQLNALNLLIFLLPMSHAPQLYHYAYKNLLQLIK